MTTEYNTKHILKVYSEIVKLNKTKMNTEIKLVLLVYSSIWFKNV